ncbi:MAG: hypothetical protein V1871_07070 [Planctomycetota bacterium]
MKKILSLKIIIGILLIVFITTFNYGGCGGGGGGSSSGSSGSAIPSATTAPTVTTNPADNITDVSVSLNGTINPKGVAMIAYFEYGTSTAYGSTTAYQNISSGTSNVNVSADLTGLSANITYNFRIKAIRGSPTTGTLYNGANQTFTTAGLPPTCVTSDANNITSNSARLNGTVNPNGGATTAYFNYGLTTSYRGTTTSQSIGNGTSNVAIMADISGLLINALYNFRIVGINTYGTLYGNNLTFSTTGSPTPTCTTNSATNITSTSARLNGTVNPNGITTNACFNYGLTTSYTVTTTSQAIGSGTSNVAIAADISGLSAGTLYNFRVVATGTGGQTNGSNQTLTTNAPPAPTCTTNPASNITLISAILNGTVNPNGFTTNAYFQWGLTISYGNTSASQAIGSGTAGVVITATANSLTSNTPYNFRVVGTSSSGTTYGNNLTFTTGNVPGSAPTCTTDPANNSTYNSAILNGTVNPNELSTNAYFQWGLTTSYGNTTTSQAIGSGTTSVAITAAANSLTSNTIYNFRVVGTNTSGTIYGSNLTFTTAPPPPTCTTDAADNITYNSAVLNGTVNPNGGATTAYFNYGLTTSYTVTTTSQTLGSGAISLAITAAADNLNSNTIYNFRVVGVNATGTTYGNNLTFTTAPPPPTCTTDAANNITFNSVTLNGTVNPNGITTNASFQWGLTTSYDNTTTSQNIGSGTNNVVISATVNSLTPSTLYNFRCVATSAGGTTNGLNQTFTTSAPPPPTCTTNAATTVTYSSAILNGAVNPNGLTTNASFQWGLTTSYGNTTTSQNIGSGTTNVTVSATVNSLTPSTLYNFRVVATNDGGTINGLNQSFTTAPPPIPICTTNAANNITSTSVTLNGAVNPNGFDTNASFQWGLTTSYGSSTTSQAIGSGTTGVTVTATVSGLLPTTLYNFRIVGTNSYGTAYGSNLTFTTGNVPPAAPTCTTNSADNITYNSARLIGTVIPNSVATTAYFQWGTTTSYGNTTTSQSIGSGSVSVVVSATLGSLTTNTLYNFRCVATNSIGTTNGANRTFSHWLQSAFSSGTFNNTVSANSDNDVILATASNNWIQRYSTTITPSARDSHVMAYDSYRGVTVLFGGNPSNSETWEWNGINWSLRTTSGPSAREASAMVYDSIRRVTVLFGGYISSSGGYESNETWEWNGTSWSLRTTSGPSAREAHAMVYDSSRGVTVLFGGITGGNETWEWNGTSWSLRTTTGPSSRAWHSMAYDSTRNVTVLFGGYGSSVSNETWEWNGTSWSLRTTTGPSGRYWHAMVYNVARSATVLFGGTIGANNNETWEWNGTSWSQLIPGTSPSARFAHAMAYDSARSTIVLFGGSSTVRGNDTWEWSWGSLYASTGTYISDSIAPSSVSSWSVLTFSYNAPTGSAITVDVLRASDNFALVTNVPSGTNLLNYPALVGVTGIRLRANLVTTNTNSTPTLFDLGVGYEGP